MSEATILRMKEKKWGVMVHLLEGIQNDPEHDANENIGKTSWDELIDSIDVEEIARELHEMGAGWFLITIMQGAKYMIAPNKTYDKLTGFQPGEACSKRDLPLDLYEALKKYDIDLYLYYTGDGPHKDEQAGNGLGWYDGDPNGKKECFYQNWTSVLKEYAERYKGKVKGWWIDGCYSYHGYNDNILKIYDDAIKSADENYIVAYNDGAAINKVWEGPKSLRYDINNGDEQRIDVTLCRCSIYDDFLAGEALDFNMLPTGNEDCQWHILSPLSGVGDWGCGWAFDGVKYSVGYFAKYLKEVLTKGGVVTVEMGLRRSGKFFDCQYKFMKDVKEFFNDLEDKK